MISMTSCPNSFLSVKASLVRSSTLEDWPYLRNSCWGAKMPSLTIMEGMFKALCAANLCLAHNWESWKEMKYNKLRRAHLNDSQITLWNKSHSNEWEWACSHLATEGTPVNRYPCTRKPQLVGGLTSHTEIRKIVLSNLEIVLSPRSKKSGIEIWC